MLKSQLEIIEQGQLYLNNTSKEDYTAIISPNFISSAGSHMRHIIDHYLALMSGVDNKLIDYDKRVRGSEIELSPVLAINKLNRVSDWIKSLTEEQLNQLITLKTEVSVTCKNIQKVQTSIGRELVFVSSHAVHHYAMIAQISFAQKSLLTPSFGLAPATATFLRETSKSSNVNKKVINKCVH